MKQLPPEIIDGILYAISAVVGWFTRWLQSKAKEKHQSQVIEEQRRYINNNLNRKQQ